MNIHQPNNDADLLTLMWERPDGSAKADISAGYFLVPRL